MQTGVKNSSMYKINIRNFSSRSGLLMVYQDAQSLEILSTHRTERSETTYLLLRENGYYADQNAGEKNINPKYR